MTKNPILNALAAIAYIAIVASFMFFQMEHGNHENSVIVPITVLALFTLSAAVMGYIFGSQPLQLYLDGKKKQGVDLFLKTLGVFTGITILLLILLSSGVLS